MAEGNASEGSAKPRQVLGDLTNILGKRGSSEIEKIGVKSSNFIDKDSAKRIRVVPPAQSEIHSPKANTNQLRCQTVSKISSNLNADIKNDALPNVNLTAAENSDGPNLTDLKEERVMSSTAFEENEIPQTGQSEFVNVEGNENDLNINEGSRVGFGSSKESKVVEDICFKADDGLCDALEAATETGVYCLDKDSGFDGYESKGSQSDANECHHHPPHHDGDEHNLALSQCGSVDCVNILPESQESTVFGMEKFAEMRNGKEKCVSEETEPTRTCSCSFCKKAGYMWLDLNYQDIKARVPALKKSQKEASILAERIIRSKSIEKNSAESFSGSSRLESDLVCQWVSLFQHMAGVLEQESNQLESRLLPLNDLREKCKRDLESIGDD
ncbi:Unknown protein [Striga hermonthica]|uniref:Uncharacterized protein n=1 Tax=Striga hermonthica TaxID=68872 RepID=A0A9N7NHC5_STRHE|nr:Unknown protein [Striga hermonthica]